MITAPRGTLDVEATRTRPAVEVSADGAGVVSHAGSQLLSDLADRKTLTGQLSSVFAGRTAPQTAHDRTGAQGRGGDDCRRRRGDQRHRDVDRSARCVRCGGLGLDVLAGAGLGHGY